MLLLGSRTSEGAGSICETVGSSVPAEVAVSVGQDGIVALEEEVEDDRVAGLPWV